MNFATDKTIKLLSARNSEGDPLFLPTTFAKVDDESPVWFFADMDGSGLPDLVMLHNLHTLTLSEVLVNGESSIISARYDYLELNIAKQPRGGFANEIELPAAAVANSMFPEKALIAANLADPVCQDESVKRTPW